VKVILNSIPIKDELVISNKLVDFIVQLTRAPFKEKIAK
jgi:hypothetical protein